MKTSKQKRFAAIFAGVLCISCLSAPLAVDAEGNLSRLSCPIFYPSIYAILFSQIIAVPFQIDGIHR